MQRSELWPVPSAHRSYWEQHNCAHVYEYDPTDDGPEVGAIRQIFYRHDDLDIEIERNTYQIYLLLNNRSPTLRKLTSASVDSTSTTRREGCSIEFLTHRRTRNYLPLRNVQL